MTTNETTTKEVKDMDTLTAVAPTYKVQDTTGEVLATGISNYPAAARLADHYTRTRKILAIVEPER